MSEFALMWAHIISSLTMSIIAWRIAYVEMKAGRGAEGYVLAGAISPAITMIVPPILLIGAIGWALTGIPRLIIKALIKINN